MKYQSVVVGATGLTGQSLLRELAAQKKSTAAVVRRKGDVPGIEYLVQDFENFQCPPAEDFYYCFGTTLKNAGSHEEFRRIELDLGGKILESAKAAGVQKMILLSAAGTSKNSFFFYSKVKALLEEKATQLNFPSLVIVRPSLLLGARQEQRPAEALMQKISTPIRKLMGGKLSLYQPVFADEVAKTMVRVSEKSRSGCQIISNDQILKLGQTF